MKILLISSYLPYPLYSGGQVRLYNLIKELSQKHEITLICERRPNETDSDVEEAAKICKEVITVKRKKQWSLGNIVNTVKSSQSFLTTGHTLPEMRQKIQSVLDKEQFDVIHVETFYIIQNMPETKIPIVLVEHNIEYKVYERFKNKVLLPLRLLLAIDINKIKKEEELAWKRAAQIVAVSKDDQKIIQAKGYAVSVVANGVNTEKFSLKKFEELPKKDKKILFIGDFKWLQNKDSASFIIKDVWPLLKANKDLTLWFVARTIPQSIRSLTNDVNILFDENSSANETQEIFQEADVLLAPIRVGGGTSYKILESMSCGTPVITMSLSADAIEAHDGEELLVGKDAAELALKTSNILEDKKLYQHVSKKGRAFIEQHYRWEEIAKDLDSVYKKASAR
jgi:glycosyltransferase involved in cell wall biosynthesis